MRYIKINIKGDSIDGYYFLGYFSLLEFSSLTAQQSARTVVVLIGYVNK